MKIMPRLCEYGCGQPAKFYYMPSRKLPKGRHACSYHSRKCPANIAKTSGENNGMNTKPESRLIISIKNSEHQREGSPARLKLEQTMIEKYGVRCNFNLPEHKEREIAVKVANGRFIDPLLKSDFQRYEEQVNMETRKTYKKFIHIINPNNLIRGRRNHQYQLDHIMSIADGFRLGIDPKIISHPVNLRMMNAAENKSKNSRSDHTIEELLEAINRFNLTKVT